jgi:DNA-binding transcriptional LysR family regulator
MQICMEWRSVRFDWNRLRAFLVTAEEGSLSRAAGALGLTQPTLGRQVAALEEELGVLLFDRAGRGLKLTPAGLDLMDHARAMGEAASRLSLAAAGNAQVLEGAVTITASETIAAYFLPPVIAKLRELAPGLSIDLVASNSPSDLTRREADIAVRSFRPTQPDLIARKARDVEVHLFATPAYLARIGRPRAPGDLAGADFIGFDRSEALIGALRGIGLDLSQAHFRLVSENHLVGWNMVRAGLGIGIMVAPVGAADPAVERVLPDLPPLGFPIWITAHRELRTSRRMRVIFDLLVRELSAPSDPDSSTSS